MKRLIATAKRPNRVYIGNVIDVLKTFPDEAVHCCVTSPPYWGLRKYDIPDVVFDGKEGCKHEWGDDVIKPKNTWGVPNSGGTATGKMNIKGTENFAVVPESKSKFCLHCHAWCGQLGLEPTPELYVKHLVDIFREVKRVLRKDGTCWVNLGDLYSQNNPGRGGGWAKDKSTYPNAPTQRIEQIQRSTVVDGLKPKDLVGIPWLVAFALRADGWYLRSEIIWHKPNPMPESVTDRPTKAHEQIFLLAKNGKTILWRHEVTKEWVWKEPKPDYKYWIDEHGKKHKKNLWGGFDYYFDLDSVREPHRDKNGIERFKGKCGIGERHNTQGWAGGKVILDKNRNYNPNGRNIRTVWTMTKDEWLQYCANLYDNRDFEDVWTIATQRYSEAHFATFPERLIIPCIKVGCPVGGTILDPFIGSGTVGKMSILLKRNWIGIDLGKNYGELIEKRISGVYRPNFEDPIIDGKEPPKKKGLLW